MPQSFVRATKNLPFTGPAPNGYSELDAGGDIGGPIIKNRLTFFAAFNPQYRTNHYLTQTFSHEVSGKINTPFYSGKVSWVVNNNNTATFSTFGDFTKEKGHLYAQNLLLANGFGVDEGAFQGTRETGGHNYAARLNSNIRQNWIGEFSFGMHFQRNNLIPSTSLDIPLITDAFAILAPNGTIAPITQTGVNGILRTGQVDYAYVPGGTLQRNYIQSAGFGLYQTQSRDRWEAAARLQNIWDQHTIKYGFEFYENKYNIFQDSTGPNNVFANPNNVGSNNGTEEAPAIADTLGDVDANLDRIENREALRPLLASLPERERTVLLLRFFESMTQTQIAERVGISQMHVSRLLAKSLARLRDQLE